MTKGLDRKYHLLFHLILKIFCVDLSTGLAANQPFIRTLQHTLIQSAIDRQVRLQSELACASLCVISACKTAAWGKVESLCLLSRQDSANNGVTNNNLQPMNDWTVISKVLFDVTAFEGPTGQHTLSFDKAVALCNNMGATIATPEDLLHARSMGYQWCRCGWLSDESNGMVMLYWDQACMQAFTTDIYYCSRTTADVYCMWSSIIP